MFTRISAILAALSIACGASAETRVAVGYLGVEVDVPVTLSNLDPIPKDLGLAGARLALEDNRTTGRFLGHEYHLEEVFIPLGEDPVAAAKNVLAKSDFLIVDAPPTVLLRISDMPEASETLIFNTSAPDNLLRSDACRANVFHTLPSHSMRSDALAQFLVTRRWTDIALITGEYPQDLAFADAIRRSATKFQLRLRGEKTWTFDADMRRTASQEVPLFTQDFRDHHILVVADEAEDFGRYIAYNTWLPRPVAGSEGVVPRAWSDVVEQWGAAQLQSRFEDLAGRGMQDEDYAAWAALRSIGEAVTRTGTGDAETIREYLLSDAFELAGFKGRPMSFRTWNGQLRQPIPLVTERAVVATAPLDGFLHQRNELDTLGLDAPESDCQAFGDR